MLHQWLNEISYIGPASHKLCLALANETCYTSVSATFACPDSLRFCGMALESSQMGAWWDNLSTISMAWKPALWWIRSISRQPNRYSVIPTCPFPSTDNAILLVSCLIYQRSTVGMESYAVVLVRGYADLYEIAYLKTHHNLFVTSYTYDITNKWLWVDGWGQVIQCWGVYQCQWKSYQANYESSTVSSASFIATYSNCCFKYYS